MIEISTPEVAIWPRELDFGLRGRNRKAQDIAGFPGRYIAEGNIPAREGYRSGSGTHDLDT